MPIEDVDYLKQNSIVQSYIFLVDSRDRDRGAYPTPSEYVTTFTMPFTNVIGLQLIDASIPRTMYNIDNYNNTISFYIHSQSNTDPLSVSSNYKSIFVEPGNYTIQTLLPTLTKLLTMHVDDDESKPIATITARSVSNPPDLKNKIEFRCPYPFAFDMKNSTIAETLGFDLFADPIERYSYTKINSSSNENNQLYHSVNITPTNTSNPVLSDPYPLFTGPRGVLRKLDVSSTKYVAQRFTVGSRTYLTGINAAFAFDSGSPVPFSIHTGSAISPYMAPQYTLLTSNMNIDAVNGTLSDTSINPPVLLVENTYYWLMFGKNDMTSSTAIYYNDINPYIGLHTLYSSSDSGITWTTPDVADINYQLSVQIIVADEYNRIEAPGIFNLIGEPYIVLRCPEIEQNSFRSLSAMKNSLGLAKINLGIVGYTDPRFDYNSVPSRDFHPIGKFSRMTVRFETSKGKLYDFKGVNHTLTFAIRYYEPTQKNKFEYSLINPNYDGDFLKYMFHRGDENAEEDSDDESEDYSRDNLKNYRVVEARNTPERLEYEDREREWYYNSAA